MVPSSCSHRDKSDTCFNKSAGEEHSLTGGIDPIPFLHFLVLGLEIKGFSRLLRGNHGVSMLVEGIHGGEGVGFLERLKVIIDGLQQRTSTRKSLVVNAGRQCEISYLEALPGRVVTQREGPVCRG